MEKETLASLILDVHGRRDREEESNLPIQVKTDKRSQNSDFFSIRREADGLPRRYCETNLVVMLRDPSWLYCYWDIEDRILAKLSSEEGFSGLILRLTELDGANWAQESRIDWFDISIQFEDLHRYINLPAVDTFYGVEIYAQIGSEYFVVVRSNVVENSRDYVSPIPHTSDFNRDQLIQLSGYSTDVGSFPGNASFITPGGEP